MSYRCLPDRDWLEEGASPSSHVTRFLRTYPFRLCVVVMVNSLSQGTCFAGMGRSPKILASASRNPGRKGIAVLETTGASSSYFVGLVSSCAWAQPTEWTNKSDKKHCVGFTSPFNFLLTEYRVACQTPPVLIQSFWKTTEPFSFLTAVCTASRSGAATGRAPELAAWTRS